MGRTIGLIFALQDKCSPSIKKLADKIGITEKEAKKLHNQIGKLSKELGGNLKKACTVVSAGVVGSIGALSALAVKSSQTCDRIDDLSNKIGISRAGFQEWDYLLGQNGASIESLQMGFKTLVNQINGVTQGNKKSVATSKNSTKAVNMPKTKSSEVNNSNAKNTPKSKKANSKSAQTTSASKKVTSSRVAKTTNVSKKATSSRTAKKATSSAKITKKRATKKSSAEKPIISNVEYYDLPYRYNETVVKILAQTPTNLFVYWDISDEDRSSYIKQYGEDFFNNTKPVLIITNKTMNYSFEVEINDYANSWYVHLNDADCDYSVELGRRPIYANSNIANYIYVSTSNDMEMPNNHILFDRLGKTVFFKNVKNNFVEEKEISSISFMKNIGKVYNIYEIYKEIYKDEINLEELDRENIRLNLSSSNSSTFK